MLVLNNHITYLTIYLELLVIYLLTSLLRCRWTKGCNSSDYSRQN